jgi:hypothetical protein
MVRVKDGLAIQVCWNPIHLERRFLLMIDDATVENDLSFAKVEQ